MAAAADPKAGAVERAAAENKLSRALVNLQATAEAYPQLQANQNFMDLQNQLSQLEQKIAYARQFYNDVVLKFNTAIETVPSNIIAGLFHFTQAQYFEADEQSRQCRRSASRSEWPEPAASYRLKGDDNVREARIWCRRGRGGDHGDCGPARHVHHRVRR